ncbi:MAG: hypothetical protein WDM86_03245 [Rhizomicrobium sp.]
MTGTYDPYGGDGGGFDPGGDGGGGGGSGGSGDDGHPGGVALDHEDCKANHIAADIKSQGDYAGSADQHAAHEFGSLLYLDPDGNLQSTTLSESPASLTEHLSISGGIPAGSTIVGIIHDHPAAAGTDESEPSAYDWGQVRSLEDTSSSGLLAQLGLHDINVDPNLEEYILDDKSGQLFRYDMSQIDDTTHPGTAVAPCG